MIEHETLDKSLSVFSTPFRLLGTEFGNRMTVVSLPSGKLWLHSPVSIDHTVSEKLRAMGEVSYIVSPNLFHHLHLKKMVSFFPRATVYGVPGIEKKVRDMEFVRLDERNNDTIWESQIEWTHIHGMPKVNEVVFFHKSSKTLIVTDLVFHLLNKRGWSSCLFRLNGVNETLSTSRLLKMMIKDRPKFVDSLKKIFEWDFNKVVLSHGDIIKHEGYQKLRSSLSWALE